MSKISFSFFAYFCLKNMNKNSIKMKIDSLNFLLFTTILLYQVNVWRVGGAQNVLLSE